MIDSGTSDNYMTEKVAATARLPIDRMCKLNVRLVDSETRASLGLVCAVHVIFAPAVVQTLDFWVVPLAIDAILGIPWLQSTQPAIYWGLSHVLWQHKGSVITVYGRGGLPPPPLPPVYVVFFAKHFLRDAENSLY